MVKIKICGVRAEHTLQDLEPLGIDFIGLNFVSWSPRRVSTDLAKVITANARHPIPVGVFFNQSATEVRRIADRVGLQWVQLHGQESREMLAALASDFNIINAGTVDDLDALGALEDLASWILVDGRAPGSGRPFDWAQLRERRFARPLMLAGGLHPGNVQRAIHDISPSAVDTASGVERDGVIDSMRVRAFVDAVRDATRPSG